MNKIKKWLSGWLTALFAVILTLASVTGCGSGVDGELIAEIGMAVLEEYAAAEMAGASVDDQQHIMQGSDDQQEGIEESSAQASEDTAQNVESQKQDVEADASGTKDQAAEADKSETKDQAAEADKSGTKAQTTETGKVETEAQATGAGESENQNQVIESRDSKTQPESSGKKSETDAQIEQAEVQSENTGKKQAEEAESEPQIDEDGSYTSKEDVALYLHTYGKLPSNFITKNEAEELGWKQKQGEAGQLHVVAPGKSIGGSKFGNYEGLLPKAKGRQYYECDINYIKGNRGAERIVYSNDGLIFYTGDHYETFEQLYP